MWRRVLSQSPVEVPQDADGMLRTQQYLNGWKALGALLHSGRSLSSRERDCCFLNMRAQQFADVSSAVGFDDPSDGRGLAVVDWDMDGDLDLWMTNRTAPRVRYLQNGLPSGTHYLALKLRGVRANRDAIGVRVELELKKDPQAKIVQTLSAGEGFISQSSKWIHFGLGQETDIERIVVRWPGGTSEEFRGLVADRRYEIVQDTGVAKLWSRTGQPGQLASSTPQVPPPTPAKRIVLPQRRPMPELDFHDLNGQSFQLSDLAGRPLLINLWAGWCGPCLMELENWKKHFEQIGPQVVILAIDVEHLGDDPLSHVAETSSTWEKLNLPMRAAVVDDSTFEKLEVVDRTLLLDQGPLPIPTSILVDPEGRLAVVYKGPVSVEQLLADVASLARSDGDVRNAAVPFSGQWYTDPFPPDLIAIPAQMVGLGRGADAYDYLSRHVTGMQPGDATSAWQQLGVTAQKASKVFHNTALLLVQEGKPNEAAQTFRLALQYQPAAWETHVQLSGLLIRLGASAEAIAQTREMLRLRPNHPIALNNMAWVLATSNDSQIRDVPKAITLAERVCQATGHQEPTALDTLAVAYAAAGRFPDAMDTANKAVRVATTLGRKDVAEQIRARLRQYELGKAYQPAASP